MTVFVVVYRCVNLFTSLFWRLFRLVLIHRRTRKRIFSGLNPMAKLGRRKSIAITARQLRIWLHKKISEPNITVVVIFKQSQNYGEQLGWQRRIKINDFSGRWFCKGENHNITTGQYEGVVKSLIWDDSPNIIAGNFCSVGLGSGKLTDKY